MDKNSISCPITSVEFFRVIQELREYAVCNEQLPRNIEAFLQHAEELQRKNMREEALALASAWMPPPEMGGVTDHVQSSLKVRTVGSIQANPHDFVSRLRNTWPGKVYVNYLKRNILVRLTVQLIWRNGYLLYVNHFSTLLFDRKAKRWHSLTKLGEFAEKRKILKYKLADAALVETPEPKVFPACDQSCLDVSRNRYNFPEIFVATINKAITYGGTNLILADGEVVCHDLYDFERDYTSEELHGRTLIDPKLRRIRWLLHDEVPESIAEAATFVDACALNYAHWITEVLPRIVLFCADERFKGVPIVVNDGLHKNIMESLSLIAGTEREIITLQIGRALVVDTLYLTSAAGYVPFERRTKTQSDHSHGVFSPQPLNMIRKRMNELGQKTKDQVWPEKIFLRRTSGTRKVTNAVELEKILLDRGYVIVEPEKLTFVQQTQLFNNAKEIVALTGAALSNAIFCKPGTHVAILMGKHEDMIYKYWLNMLAPLQVRVFYVLGNIVKNHDLGIHGDFFVNETALMDLLEVFGKK
jgi:capsular polysaccharide biosynthesis protein